MVFVDAALEAMTGDGDERLSLTDCVSFEVIARLGLDGALPLTRISAPAAFRCFPGHLQGWTW
jgi:hypothetical protein